MAQTLDKRLSTYLEARTGLPVELFPSKGIRVEESPKRSDEVGNRIAVHRYAAFGGLLVSVRDGLADKVRNAVIRLSVAEVFSPLGLSVLCQAGGCRESFEGESFYGFGYSLSELSDFILLTDLPPVVELPRSDVQPEEYLLGLSERVPEPDDFVCGFAVHLTKKDFRSEELGSFGSRCASVAVATLAPGPVARVAVKTEKSCSGQGYGTSTVSAATRRIVESGDIALYDASADNISSLRIARKLGFVWFNQEMKI